MKKAEVIYKRKVVDEIIKYLDDDFAILLYGARQVGKTFILYFLEEFLINKGEQVFYIDLEDRRYLYELNNGPQNLNNLLVENGFNIEKRVYVLLDEIQYLKDPTNFLKLVVDHYKNIKIIACGSSIIEIRKKFSKALVGRTIVFEVFGLSFEEFLVFKGYNKKITLTMTKIMQEELKELFEEFIIYGGYPKVALIAEKEKKEKYLLQIVDTYVKKDVRDMAEVRDIEKFNKLLEVLASQTGNILNICEIANTCKISKQTIDRYLTILESSYIIKLVRPFHKNLSSELFKMPKVYFYDSGLVNILWLKIIPKEILGNIFETAIFSELVKNFGKDNIYYWRTKDKKEIDFILKYKENVIPIETKLNFASISNSAVKYFIEKYNLNKYYFVLLRGEKGTNQHFIYPWEIPGIS
jgi:predicted AAA+ superfamily ATPase